MSNYVKQVWTDGSSSVSAARMGVIENGIYDAHFQPAARAYNSAAQSIPNITLTALTFDSERFDTDTIHDTVTNNTRLTCKTAGKYLITGTYGLTGSSAGTYRDIQIRLNGATTISRVVTNPNASLHYLSTTTIWDMAVNDYVELMAAQDSGGALSTLQAASFTPEFMMVRVA